MALLLPRSVREGSCFYYVTFGGIVTLLYLLLIHDSVHNGTDNNVSVYNQNLSRRIYEYEDICREWQIAKFQEKSESVNLKLDQSKEPSLALGEYQDNSATTTQFICDNSYKGKHVTQRGQFYVINNFVLAESDFGCMDSITLSAPGDYRFLDNIIPLVDRWRGPISVALYAPGDDFYKTIESIAYLRNCESPLIRELVTFHVLFEQSHTPKQRNGTIILDSYKDDYNCFIPAPWLTTKDEEMYKAKNSLLYPINVARNVAKLNARTYFVFPSDIELYPTRNFILLFFNFVTENMELFQRDSRNVFVLPVFEVLEDQAVPENKTQLLAMLKEKTAILFHQTVCIICHRVIESEKWVRTPETEGLGVFSVGKRTGRYMVWEPFYVCTQKEPLWDERMTWEGQGNKMIQAYTMCVMNYDFHVLDNAFLIHKPGVKKKKVQMEKFNNVVQKSNAIIKDIAIELQELYGYSDQCAIKYKSVLRKPSSLLAKATAKMEKRSSKTTNPKIEPQLES